MAEKEIKENKGEAKSVPKEPKLEMQIEKAEDTKEVAEEQVLAAEGKEEKAKSEEKVEKKKEERTGIVYIYSTFNNTMVHITDLAGNTISRITGGMMTKTDRLKANPTIAMFVAKKAAERARDLGITSLYIRTRGQTGETGIGPGGHAAVKSLAKEGFKIISILDTTKVARGGPKKKGGKRGRRV